MDRTDWPLVVLLVGLAAGVALGLILNGPSYHTEWCTERLAHAATASDSLAVYQDDDFCLETPK